MSSRSSDEIDSRRPTTNPPLPSTAPLSFTLHTNANSNTTTTPTNPALTPTPSLPLSSANPQLPPSSNSALDPALSLPITPDALLKHVRQLKIAARIRHRSPSLNSPHPAPAFPSISIHSRAGSNASSTYDDLLTSNLAYSSSTLSTCSHDGHTTIIDAHPSSNSHCLNLTIPESHPDRSRTLTETVDLSHQRIADLTQPVVEELSEYVERLALGYNYLPVLPDHFTILGESLRYLNLRGNHMEIFPEVLTRMPSLEILDVSRNKIKAFPRRPGTLDRLRVLSVSRNRIKRLPNYIASLTVLRVLKIDHNPVVWPPKELVTFVDATDKLDEDDIDPAMRFRDDSSTHTRTRTPSTETTTTTMVQWLRILQEWMRKNPYVRPVKQARPSTGETVGDSSEYGPSRSMEFERSFNSFKVANSPDPSPMMTLNNGSAAPSPVPSTPMQPSTDHIVQHNRNASSISSSQWARKRPELRLKKSLPDLRRSHADIMVERNGDGERAHFALIRSPRVLEPHSGSSVTFSLNSPSLPDRGPRSAMPLSNGTPAGMMGNSTNHSPPGHISFKQNDLCRSSGSQIRRMKIGTSGDDDTLAGVRNSGAYFRRLSMLPASTISKQVPLPLLQLMDGIRGILFSLSQIDAALKQFVIFASQDRLPGALSRMTSAADDSMSKLINALDRFDSSTRRAQPEVEVVQQVLSSCRDNVIVFGKLVNVISIQLKVLTGAADVRYSRTLLLSLYGATAEIAMSWQTITPLVDDVISLPSLKKPKAPTQEPKDELNPSADLAKELINLPTNIRRTISREKLQEGQLTSSDSTHQNFDQVKVLPNTTGPIPSMPPLGSSTFSKSRRHAGSFIAEDVQLGATISPASAGLVNNLPLTPTFPSTSYNSSSFPPPTNDLNNLAVSGSKPDSASFLTDANRAPVANRNTSSRSHNGGDSLSKGLLSLSINENTKQTTNNDSLPVLMSPVGLPRSPAFTSIASLTANAIFSPDTASPNPFDLINQPKEVSNEKFACIPTSAVDNNNWPSRPIELPLRSANSPIRTFLPSSTMMVDIPERTTSRNYHAAKLDSSLSRTDQDFLDMAEATIEIAVSVTTMMLDNLGQATLVEQTSTNSGVLSNNNRNEAYSNASSIRRDHRKVTITSSLTKAGELKELCEVEIEVIRRLRVSLSNFWDARKAVISATIAKTNNNTTTTTNTRHPSRDGSSSSINSSASSLSSSTSATTATTTTTTVEHHPMVGAMSSSNLSAVGTSQHIAQADPSTGLANGAEAKKVFEDATAFVRAVIQTANLARATMTEYPLTKGIREGLGELTTATKELATLLAVSSFKPGSGSSNHHTRSSSPSNPTFSTSGQLSSSTSNGNNNHNCNNSNNNLMLTTLNTKDLNGGISHPALQHFD